MAPSTGAMRLRTTASYQIQKSETAIHRESHLAVLQLRFYEPSHIATRGRDRGGGPPSRQRCLEMPTSASTPDGTTTPPSMPNPTKPKFLRVYERV